MNDTSVSAAVSRGLAKVHDSLTELHMSTPVGDILDRARRRRARRRRGALVAAAGTCGSVALAAALILLPGGAARTGAKPAQLTAWTVTRQPNGDIRVTIRELKDPAGLQRKLRADGVPASVRFWGQQDSACRADDHVSLAQSPWVFLRHANPARPTVVFLVRPSALPHGSGLEIMSSVSRDLVRVRKNGHVLRLSVMLDVGVVYASPGCTGS